MEQQDRYSRHFRLPGFTTNTQLKLLNKKVCVVGVGGLGIPVLQYLIGAGVGELTLIDDDIISLSNLHRQVIYNEKNIGRLKAIVAKEILSGLNSTLKIIAKTERLTQTNLKSLIPENCDVIIDASDNFETRYTLDDFCFAENIPLVYGALHRFEGQLSVFHYQNGTSYRDLYPIAPEVGTVDNCDVNGVLGPVAGTIGCMMAIETLKILSGLGEVLSGELLVMRFDDFSILKMKIKSGQNLLTNKKSDAIPEITKEDLLSDLQKEKNYLMVDIRKPEEYNSLHIKNSINIPIEVLASGANKFPTDIPIVFICEIGKSSLEQIRILKRNGSVLNLINLSGGVKTWFNG